MGDTPDYTEATTPLPHHESHEDEGSDEISLEGLAGEPAELATHAGLPTVHQDAPDLILTHKGDAAAHHAKYTDAQAQDVADTRIGIHAALPTVHQDAPALILAHKGDHDAHHVVFTQLKDNAGIVMWPQAEAIQFTDDGKVNVDDLMPGVLLVSIDEDQFTHVHSHAHLTNITAIDHHTKYTDGEAQAVADTRIGIHAALPTVHQDAPDLILTHKGDASAHHAKYTDADARAAIYATKPCFSVRLTNTITDVTGDGTLYALTGAIWTEIVDQVDIFLNGVFTAPVTGIYLLSGVIGLDGILASHTYGYAELITSNRTYYPFSANPATIAGAASLYMPFTFYADMDVDDTAYLTVRIYNGTKVVDLTSLTYFGGSRII